MKSDSIGKLAEALAAAQAEMKPALKDQQNPFFKSRYADLSAVWEAARKPLTAHGLAVSQLVSSNEQGGVEIETLMMHTSGEWISSTITMRPVKDDPQGMGSAITYGRRYALQAIAGIAADEDDDGNAASHANDRHEPPPRREAPKAQQAKAKSNGEKAMNSDQRRIIEDLLSRPGIDTIVCPPKGGRPERPLVSWLQDLLDEGATENVAARFITFAQEGLSAIEPDEFTATDEDIPF